MNAQGFAQPIISADSHITEPPETYVDFIDPAYLDRAPRRSRHGDVPQGRIKVEKHALRDGGAQQGRFQPGVES